MIQKNDILDRQIAALETKNLTALQEKFEEFFGFIPGETKAKNLRQRIAWRLQEITLGGIPEADMAILRQLPTTTRCPTSRPSAASGWRPSGAPATSVSGRKRPTASSPWATAGSNMKAGNTSPSRPSQRS